MITPLGANTEQTAAFVHAGASQYQANSFRNRQLDPLTLALVPEEALPPLIDAFQKQAGLTARQMRLLRLATAPLQAIFEQAASKTPLPLFLAGPEKRPGRRSVISDKFLKQLAQQTDLPIDQANSYVFPYGRAAGLYALESAMLFLETHPQHRQVIMGGVDSYIDPHLLGTLLKEGRAKVPNAMDSFVPAEGAAFLLLGQPPPPGQGPAPCLLHPPGIATEPGHRYSAEPYRGDGLATAVSQALQSMTHAKINTVYASFNGENFSAKEWGVAATRNQTKFADNINLQHPADCFGDMGAAFAPIALGLLKTGIERGYLQAPALIWCSSEREHRAALCITTA